MSFSTFLICLLFPLSPTHFTLGVPALKRAPKSTLGGSEHIVEHQNILPPRKGNISGSSGSTDLARERGGESERWFNARLWYNHQDLLLFMTS